MNSPKKVFCSHRGVDKEAVEAFARRLREVGIDAWFDRWEITGGDDIVASMNRGLDECDVGLLFFSSKPWPGKWFDNELSALVVRRNEDGARLIPVAIDAEVRLPALLRPLARRSIDHFEQIVDAINGVSGKPPIGPTTTERQTTRFTVKLVGPTDGTIEIIALRNGSEVAREEGVRLTRTLQQSYAGFLDGHATPTTRGPAEAREHSLARAVTELGDALGGVLFAARIGEELRSSLKTVNAGVALELSYEATDSTLLALPFEAARLDGTVLALTAGVTVRRIVGGAPATLGRAAASPLKVLVAVGAPDEGTSSNAVLDLERELQGILDAVSPAARDNNVEVRFLEVGHPEEIGRALAHDEYHVLHLSGHGGPGTIELEDEDGRPVQVTAAALAAAIKRAGRNFPLVLLSSCHGGTATSETASMAVGLVREGIPLVLSMQTRVTDRYASDLSRELYGELARRDMPFVSQALAVARQRLEDERRRAITQGANPIDTRPEYATASLFGTDSEAMLVDYSLDRMPLAQPPVHRVPGPVPQLGIGELVGRRRELRTLLRVLRDHEDSVASIGKKAGAVLVGIGGAGKSALAGRAMARLAEEGWIVAATKDHFDILDISITLGAAIGGQADATLVALGAQLQNPELDDRARLTGIFTLLQTQRILLVLDNFEDNLEVGGAEYKDDTTATWISELAGRAQTGKLLVTCRYPLPAGDGWFAHQPLGPLSPAEIRKLLWRLPGINNLAAVDIKDVVYRIGGHPRMLEYLDGILRKGHARLPDIATRLRKAAKSLGVSLKTDIDSLDEAVRTTVLLGTRDVLLDELLSIASHAGDTATLLQCAVSSIPMDAHGVAHALADQAPGPTAVLEAQERLDRLVDLSLVAAVGANHFWVHRWTAEALLSRTDAAERKSRFASAGRYRMARRAAVADFFEATRNFLDAELFNEASALALELTRYLNDANQSVASAALGGEIARRLPTSHANWAALVDAEARNLMALGFTQQAFHRYSSMHAVFAAYVQAEPDRADHQRTLSITYERMGDLYGRLGRGDRARDAYQQALTIRDRLTLIEPNSAEYQHDLSVVHIKMGDLHVALGQLEDARDIYGQARAIRARLAQAEPERADYRRDLSVCYIKMADLFVSLGQTERARDAYQDALAIAEKLAESEPRRGEYQRDLSVSYNKTGDLYVLLGQSERAGDFYRKALAIAEGFASAEPDRADYQRDLSICCNKMGDLYRTLGKSEHAHGAYLKALEIRRRLAEAEPDRSDYQRDLSVSFNRMGDLYRSLGRDDLAREAYEQDLGIAERLSQAEPGRADYRRDLAISYGRMGDLYRSLRENARASQSYEKSMAISEQLAQAQPDHTDYQRDLSIAFTRLGDLYQALEQGERALDAYRKDLAIAERLAKAEPDRADFQRDLVVSLLNVWKSTTDREPLLRASAVLRSLKARKLLDPSDLPMLEEVERACRSN